MRYIFSMLLWVVVARWCYSEIALSAPWAIPTIDSALEYVQIPTHDQWQDLEVVKLLSDNDRLQTKLAAIAERSPLQTEQHAKAELEELLQKL